MPWTPGTCQCVVLLDAFGVVPACRCIHRAQRACCFCLSALVAAPYWQCMPYSINQPVNGWGPAVAAYATCLYVGKSGYCVPLGAYLGLGAASPGCLAWQHLRAVPRPSQMLMVLAGALAVAAVLPPYLWLTVLGRD